MRKKYFILLVLTFIVFESLYAQTSVDCRLSRYKNKICNLYGSELIGGKEITFTIDTPSTKRLIKTKNFPTPLKRRVKIISIENMMEKYTNIEESVRFKGQDKLYQSTPKDSIVQAVVEQMIKEEMEAKEIEKPLDYGDDMPLCTVEDINNTDFLDYLESIENPMVYGKYLVSEGDVLSVIASKFGIKMSEIRRLNGIKKKACLRIGDKLQLPFEQKMVDAISSASYKVEKGDSFISIAQKFRIESKKLIRYNKMKKHSILRANKMIKLPLPYVIKAEEKAKKIEEIRQVAKKRRDALLAKKNQKLYRLKGKVYGKRSMRVTATAYTSHARQTDKTPFLAAWNNRLRPGMKAIAVSRDLLRRYGIRNRSRVRIAGLPGTYTVLDKMNKRYRKRIDIYMGMNRRKALRWGRRSVVISW